MKPKYPNAEHNRGLRQIISGQRIYPSYERALGFLYDFKKQYTLSKLSLQLTDSSEFVLWIYGYELTQEELKQGYAGNFGKFYLSRDEEGSYICSVSKIEIDIKFHPIKPLNRYKFPNWGEPLLREVLKGLTYPSFDIAKRKLNGLRDAYIAATFWRDQDLVVLVYSAVYKPKPIKKFLLRITESQLGMYKISYEEDPDEMQFLGVKLFEFDVSSFL